MDYRMLAEQLLDLQPGLHQVPANRQLSALDKGAYFALNYLLTHGNAAHPKELSRDMAVSSARVAALLNHLEEQGLITRSADPEDSRKTIVSLTGEGARRIAARRDQALEVLSQALEGLGEADARDFLRIQAKLIRTMDPSRGESPLHEGEEGPSPPPCAAPTGR